MATNRSKRQPRRRASANLTPNTWHFLEAGSHLLPWDDFQSQAEVIAAWEAWRGPLLPLWVDHFPGTRPYAEWVLHLVPKHGERRLLSFGERAAWCREHDWPIPPDVDLEEQAGILRQQAELFCVLHSDLQPPIQQSQLEYLNQHDLLESGEVEVLEGRAGDRLEGKERVDFWTTCVEPLLKGD